MFFLCRRFNDNVAFALLNPLKLLQPPSQAPELWYTAVDAAEAPQVNGWVTLLPALEL